MFKTKPLKQRKFPYSFRVSEDVMATVYDIDKNIAKYKLRMEGESEIAETPLLKRELKEKDGMLYIQHKPDVIISFK